MRKVFHRLSRGQTARAWDTWRDLLSTREAQHQRMRGFAVRLLQAGVGKAWGSWVELIETQRRMRAFIGRMLNAELCARASRSSAQPWPSHLSSQPRRPLLHASWLSLAPVLACGVRLRSARAWAQWRAGAAESGVMHHFAQRMLQHGVVRAWNQWRELSEGLQSARRLGDGKSQEL